LDTAAPRLHYTSPYTIIPCISLYMQKHGRTIPFCITLRSEYRVSESQPDTGHPIRHLPDARVFRSGTVEPKRAPARGRRRTVLTPNASIKGYAGPEC